MKKTALIVIVMLVFGFSCYAQTVNIGNPTTYAYSIFNMQDPYTRHAAIYTSGEIGVTGNIASIGWNVKKVWSNGDGPVKIYLKQTMDGSLYSDTWANIKNGATVVYNSTADFPSSGENFWQSFTLSTPFNLASGNLLVLVESNYGGTGNGGAGGDIDFHATGGMNSMAELWWGNPIAVTGSLSSNRPLFQISFDNATNIELAENKVFSVFPNPVSDFITVSIPCADETTLHIEILNLLGECVTSRLVTTKADGTYKMAFDKELAPGCYLLKASFNNTTVQKKFFHL
jgi:hypothetical protein